MESKTSKNEANLDLAPELVINSKQLVGSRTSAAYNSKFKAVSTSHLNHQDQPKPIPQSGTAISHYDPESVVANRTK